MSKKDADLDVIVKELRAQMEDDRVAAEGRASWPAVYITIARSELASLLESHDAAGKLSSAAGRIVTGERQSRQPWGGGHLVSGEAFDALRGAVAFYEQAQGPEAKMPQCRPCGSDLSNDNGGWFCATCGKQYDEVPE